MMKSLLPLALVALAAQPALSQSHADAMDPTRPVATETGTGSMTDISQRPWSDAVREVFFTDETMSALRPTNEMGERWAALDPDLKEQAKSDCQAYLMDAGSMGGASVGGLGGALEPDPQEAAPGSDRPGVPVATDSTTSTDAPPSPGDATIWTQACSFVTSFQTQ